MLSDYRFTELDQYLFGHATHYDLYRKLGETAIQSADRLRDVLKEKGYRLKQK